ncbi:MAG: RluA family pseudouridine synthase [Bacteroidales bacterium]|jgi:23S rRNA pseudouridine1911/1915/1917 synthase|nr:RluA family pseudouridine synthase [Bacteroidales bacterium]
MLTSFNDSKEENAHSNVDINDVLEDDAAANAASDSENEDNDGVFENYRFVVDKGQSIMRLDRYLSTHIEGVSRNKIQQSAKANLIKVNDKAESSNYKVKPCDLIQIFLPQPPREDEVVPQDIPINIVYEDNDVLLVNKDANMVVHPAYGNWNNTLLNALMFHFHNEPTPEGNSEIPLLVHRIDKDTTGLLVVCKNESSQFFLAQQFAEHLTDRTYNALVWGNMSEDEGTIEANVGRNLKDRKIMATFPLNDHGKRAITHWKVLKRYGYVTLVECKLETGRTHQIRVHFQHIGHPLFNDSTYGGDQILKGTTSGKYRQFILNCFSLLPRQALHAKTLGFIHPTTFERMSFSSELPDDFQSVLNKWDDYTSARDI